MINEYINAYPMGISLNDIQNNTLENSGVYSYHQLKLQIDNDVEITSLTEKLNTLIQQHISLSSTYKTVDGYKGYRSLPTKVGNISVERLIWEGADEPDFNAVLALAPSLINAEASKNIQVIAVNASNSVFLFLRVSALVMDIASLVSFSQQLLSNEEFDDVLQFPDFIQWRNELFDSEEGLQGQAYWQNYINEHLVNSAALDIADLVVSDNALENMPFESELINLNESVLATIEQTAIKCNVPVSTIVTGTWWLLLARLSSQSQFNSLWYDDPKQDDEALFDALGMFQNVLPIAIKIDEKDDFISWIQKLHTQQVSHKDWAECFDAKKIKDINITAGAGYIDIPGKVASKIIDINAESFTKINQHCFNVNGKLKLSISYQQKAVSSAMVAQLLKQYIYLLSVSDTYLSNPVTAINLVSSDEKEQLLSLDNSVSQHNIDSVFKRLNYYANNQPDAIALKCDDVKYSYQELVSVVDKCASQLILLGLKEADRVGISLTKSCDLVMVMLAVMRAGGTYIPFDPQWPLQRVKQIANQAKPSFIFTDKTQLVSGIVHLSLSDLVQEEHHIQDLPALKNTNTAYMIYTSGTTGEPKGVCIGHSQLNQYCFSSSIALSLNENKHFAMTSTIAADLGYTSLFNALYNGACLHIATDEQVNDTYKFQRFLLTNKIDCIKIVPSHFMALIDDDAINYVPNKVVFGGEAAPEKLISLLFNKSNEVEIYNHYGPTESTIGVMYHQFTNFDEGKFLPKLTGVLEGSGAVILNESNELCSVGELGELHIYGKQLAQHYFNQPVESGFKLNHSFADKIYPTGDSARYLIDGGVLLVGRKDDQIKIRGFRVEPDEISHHINSFSDIDRAIVIGMNNNLIAYIVNSSRETGLLDSDLKQLYMDKLSQILPNFMIPSHWLSVKELPLFGNGKVNKSLLPKVDDFNEHTICKPENSLEALICNVMQDLLDVKQISTTQCFLDLGAHSLTVIKFVTRLRKLLKVEVEPIMVFENSNVVKLAKVLNNLGSEPSKLEKLAAIQLKLATLDIEQQQQLRRKLLL